jgi:hypothetical protein
MTAKTGLDPITRISHDRLHSSIEHLPPIEFEQQHRQATTATPTPDVA